MPAVWAGIFFCLYRRQHKIDIKWKAAWKVFARYPWPLGWLWTETLPSGFHAALSDLPSMISPVFMDGSSFWCLPSMFSPDFMDGSSFWRLSSMILANFMDGGHFDVCHPWFWLFLWTGDHHLTSVIHDFPGFYGRESFWGLPSPDEKWVVMWTEQIESGKFSNKNES